MSRPKLRIFRKERKEFGVGRGGEGEADMEYDEMLGTILPGTVSHMESRGV